MFAALPSSFQRSRDRRVMSAATARLSGVDDLASVSLGVRSLVDEGRAALFGRLCELAHRHGLHVAPEVSLMAVFTIDGGAEGRGLSLRKALRSKRVDFLLVDGSARPVLALDCAGGDRWRDRALRRDRLKRRAFAQARIPWLVLCGAPDFAEEVDLIEDRIRARLAETGGGRSAA
ncbi:DUF2726 domain-containing protein [uncultured Jannaschia sp.]|uniref:DUF2726 domain-containing protein n=1 Tax=uncultured Jannaschia sp. TaxID=293347 RepID=UPI00263191AC|nr:DUF2726 domain-containing protein [uncultured Jannaschia sp.]